MSSTNQKKDHSHYHCWDQKKGPACGIPLEKHKQCCLCTSPFPVQEVEPKREEWDSDERVKRITNAIYKEIGELHHDVWDSIKKSVYIGLTSQKQEIAGEIEDMFKKVNHVNPCNMCSPKCGYNQALEDVIDLLRP